MKLNITLLVLSVGGLLFSGYLSGVKFFEETCAFNEPCPYFLGYPACYYGFAMYLALTILSFALVFQKMRLERALQGILGVSFLGILFAGYFTLQELPTLFTKGLSAYVLGLPTCALGLIFYAAILIVGLRIHKHSRQYIS